MNPAIILLSALWGIAAGGMALYCAAVAGEITYVTLPDGRRQERRLPLMFRLLIPLSANVAPLFRRDAFADARVRLARRLTAAGYDGLISEEEFLSLRVLCPVVLGPFWVVLVHASLGLSGWEFARKAAPAFHAAGVLFLCAYPGLWLRGALAARHKSIRRSLPFVLDLLTLSVEAGMDFMTALQRNVERLVTEPLGEELLRVIREIQLGKTRKDALRSLSERVNLPDLRSVVNALVQADELGVSIGSILRIQADQIRQRRFERAEKLANEAPVKMLFPLMVFIFPAVFLVLLGPIITRMLKQLL